MKKEGGQTFILKLFSPVFSNKSVKTNSKPEKNIGGQIKITRQPLENVAPLCFSIFILFSRLFSARSRK